MMSLSRGPLDVTPGPIGPPDWSTPARRPMGALVGVTEGDG